MLFGYPIAATHDNWLHECLFETVKSIHLLVDNKKRYPKWPAILPEQWRDKLKSRTGLRDRLKSYNVEIRKLGKEPRDVVLKALEDAAEIAGLLNGVAECAVLNDLPESIHGPIESLFSFGFGLLTDLEIRDKQYKHIYDSTLEHVCPFCGTEYFDAPGASREALDHYLTKSKYPFAAVNLRNLVPMGHKCNSNYKLAEDITRGANGVRRVAFDPYSHVSLSVSLDQSDPYNGSSEYIPDWDVQFFPNSPAVATWDEVFSIRQRYRRDHLDPSFSAWLSLFGQWARRKDLQVDSDADLIAALQHFESFWNDNGISDRAFLKAAVFRMLRKHCELGHQRLLSQLRNLISPPLGAAG